MEKSISEDCFEPALRTYFVSADFEDVYAGLSEMQVMATSMKDAAIIFSNILSNEEKLRMMAAAEGEGEEDYESDLFLTVTDTEDSTSKYFYISFEIKINVQGIIR
jgi:hypothetical protein